MTFPLPPIPVYLNPDLPIDERIEDLLARLTLPEKVSQMTNEAAAIPRLGIPAYDFWSEGLHGVARNGRATIFPQAIGMAATWDTELIQQVASAIGDEARAKYHDALARCGSTARYQGLNIWSPNINIFRDPRWGRGQETWGEDPFLTGEMGSAFVRGLQGDDPVYLKTAACAKHLAVHSGPEKLRHRFDACPTPADLYQTYLPAFKKLVMEAKVEAVMGAYNRVHGVPACASEFLLNQTLRQEWGFTGHVVSDCWALGNIYKEHGYTSSAVETAAVALKAGCDLACMCTFDRLGEAVKQGLITEADIDLALSRTLRTRFKLGMFDPPERVPYSATPISLVNSPAHRQLAYQAALESVTLLKNQDQTLPIPEGTRRIMVVGPNAASLDVLLGNYHGLSDHLTSLLEGIAAAAPPGIQLDYRPGCTLTQKMSNPINWSLGDASAAEVTIACMGLSPQLEGEEGESILSAEYGDRDRIELPAVQMEYLEALVKARAKVILVLTGGSPIALGRLAEKMAAILQVWYPGQEGGQAVADILFGKANPSGKLPVTFPAATSDLPPFEDYSMKGRTYRYSEREPLFPFGFGLSYTQFRLSNLHLEKETIRTNEPLRCEVTLTNRGPVDGAEVLQVYLRNLQAHPSDPYCSLAAFRRVALRTGESQVIQFELRAEQLARTDEKGIQRVEPGKYEVKVADCSPGRRGTQLGAIEPLSRVFSIND